MKMLLNIIEREIKAIELHRARKSDHFLIIFGHGAPLHICHVCYYKLFATYI